VNLGDVYIGTKKVGECTTQQQYASGSVLVDITDAGTFSFPTLSGTVYVGSLEVGVYNGIMPDIPTKGLIGYSNLNPVLINPIELL